MCIHCNVNNILGKQIHAVIMTALFSTKWLTKEKYHCLTIRKYCMSFATHCENSNHKYTLRTFVLKDMEHQTTAERSCSIWATSNHGWHPIFTASSMYDKLPLTHPLNTAGGPCDRSGGKVAYSPYHNIIMLTFSSQMAASQITTPLLLFIAASQSLKGTITKTILPKCSEKHLTHGALLF